MQYQYQYECPDDGREHGGIFPICEICQADWIAARPQRRFVDRDENSEPPEPYWAAIMNPETEEFYDWPTYSHFSVYFENGLLYESHKTDWITGWSIPKEEGQ